MALMLFLKSIYCSGFKSFAHVTDIPFKYNLIGVIGPNGSGKSNIVDAIRWALGEGSFKSLRGSESDDFLFKGTNDIAAKNVAEVRLTFYNRINFWNKELEEIEISRVYNAMSSENSYFINQIPVRRKDVTDFAVKTNLHRNALAIISQGQIADIADASWETRRRFFDNALGIYHYKQQKNKCFNRLMKTKTNLTKLDIIKNETLKQLAVLKRKKTIAEKYQTYKTELQKIELPLLVHDLKNAYHNNATFADQQTKLKQQHSQLTIKINHLESMSDKLSREGYATDVKINTLQKQFATLTAKISEYQVLKISAHPPKDNQSDTKQQQREQKYIYQNVFNQLEAIVRTLSDLQQAQQQTKTTIVQSENDLFTFRQQLSNLNLKLQNLEARKKTLQSDTTNEPHFYQKSLKTLFGYRDYLVGIIDIVGHLFSYDDQYRVALQIALQSRFYNVVVESLSATEAIMKFAKKNYLTAIIFLPLDNIRATYLREEEIFALERTPGFIGIACDLVECETKFDELATYLLGRTIICENYKAGLSVSRLLKQRRSVITLDGIHFQPYGAVVSRDYSRKKKNKISLQNQIATVNADCKQVAHMIMVVQRQINDKQKLLKEHQNKLNQINFEIGSTKKEQQMLQKKITQLRTVYFKKFQVEITADLDHAQGDDDYTQRINDTENAKTKIEDEITLLMTQKNADQQEYQSISEQIKITRGDLNAVNNQLFNLKKVKSDSATTTNENLRRLVSEYKITYEEAVDQIKTKHVQTDQGTRQKIVNLRYQVHNYGNVDLQSITEYDALKQDAIYLNTEINQLENAIKKLDRLITKIDQIMAERFAERLIATNKSIDNIFKIFFPSGQLKLVLEDEQDLLESPIFLNFHLPGKKVDQMSLLSGGEKTVIALIILFAILRTQKLPLVILDEADAALDSRNVSLFSKYLKEFSKITQFIIITHNRMTMEYCDLLHAVTMPTKGITTVISATLKEHKFLIFE